MLVAANIACDGCWTLAIAGSGVSAGASFLVGAGLTAWSYPKGCCVIPSQYVLGFCSKYKDKHYLCG